MILWCTKKCLENRTPWCTMCAFFRSSQALSGTEVIIQVSTWTLRWTWFSAFYKLYCHTVRSDCAWEYSHIRISRVSLCKEKVSLNVLDNANICAFHCAFFWGIHSLLNLSSQDRISRRKRAERKYIYKQGPAIKRGSDYGMRSLGKKFALVKVELNIDDRGKQRTFLLMKALVLNLRTVLFHIDLQLLTSMPHWVYWVASYCDIDWVGTKRIWNENIFPVGPTTSRQYYHKQLASIAFTYLPCNLKMRTREKHPPAHKACEPKHIPLCLYMQTIIPVALETA